MIRKQLPKNIPLEKVPSILKSHVFKKHDALIDELHEFMKTQLEPSVESAKVCVFPEEYDQSSCSVWIYFDGKHNKVDSKDERLFAGRSLKLYSDFSHIPLLDEAVYEALVYPHLITDLVINWFAECWWKAGGWYYPVPVEIEGHDGFGNSVITLSTGQF